MPVMYGDQQSQLTMNRAAFGDVPAAMITGAQTTFGGAAQGFNNMMGDIGQFVMPAMYTPPARIHIGSQGMVQQHTGLMRGLFGMVGLGPQTPSGITHAEFGMANAADVGERVASGGAAVAGLAAGVGVGATVGRFAGMGVGAALGSLVGMPGIGATVGGFVGGAAGMMMTEAGIAGGVNQRREIQNFLSSSSFRFVGAGSSMSDPRTGTGMSRSSRAEVSDFIRKEDIADPMFDTGELTNVLKQGTQLGLFTGTSDMDDFKSKFKDIVKNVKSVTRVLHQTLEEGMKTIKDLKTIGVDPSQAAAIVQQADSLGKVAGRTGAEMLSVGMQGAELFRGTGVDMGIGFQSNQMNLASIRASRDAGALSQEAIAQAGGEEALSQRMTASGMAFSQSAVGRGTGAQFFTGGAFNQQSFMNNMMSGGGNFVSGVQNAAANLSSPSALIAYQANQEKFLSDMGNTLGGRGLAFNQLASAASQAEFLARNTGASKEDAFRLTLKQQGKSHSEIEAHIAEMSSSSEGFGRSQAGASASRDKLLIEEARESALFTRLGARAGDLAKGAYDIVASPLSKMIDSAGEGFTSFYESQYLGVQRADIRGIDTQGLSDKDLARFRARKRSAADLDVGGTIGKDTSGEALAGVLEGDNVFGAATKNRNPNVLFGRSPGPDEVILNDIGGSGRSQTITRRQLNHLAGQTQFLVSNEQAAAMQKDGKLEDVRSGLGASLMSGDLGKVTDMDELVKAAYGANVTAEDLTKEQVAKLRVQVKGTRFEGMIDKTADIVAKARIAKNDLGVADLISTQEMAEGDISSLTEALGGGVSSAATQDIAKAMGITNKGKREAALDKIGMAIMRETGDEGKARSVIEKAKSGDGAVVTASDNTRSSMAGVAEVQRQRGTDLMASILDHRINNDPRAADLTLAETKRAQKIVKQIEKGGMGAIEDSDREFIKKTGLAEDLFRSTDLIKEAQGIVSGEGTREEKSKKLSDFMRKRIDPKLKGDALTSKVAQALDDSSGFARDLMTEHLDKAAGKTAATGGGGGGADGTAQQVFIQQSSINTQILSVLQGLAQRVGVK